MIQNNDRSRNVPTDTDSLPSLTVTFTHPDDVLHSRALSQAEKRVVLAAWASDAYAVPNLPALRQLDSGAIVSIDSVLAALRALDGREASARTLAGPPGLGPTRMAFRPWRRPRRDGGDDDPPPCPATALPPGLELELRRRRDESWQPAAA